MRESRYRTFTNEHQQLSAKAAENPYPFETRLMTSALHHLGSQTAEKHLSNVVAGVKRGGASRPTPMGWLGKQRRYQAEAIYVSTPHRSRFAFDEEESLIVVQSRG
jgi:hypothetical protein